MQANWSIFQKNVRNIIPGLQAMLAKRESAFNTWKKIHCRGKKLGPTDFAEQKEVYTPDYWKRGICQKTNFWVDRELAKEVSQTEIAELIQYKQDLWKLAHCAAVGAILGGYALPLAFVWLGSDTWVPSTFNTTKEEKKAWLEAQDTYRYRSVPSYLTETKWNFDFHAYPFTPAQERAWDDLFEKNDVHRDPKVVRQAAAMYDHYCTFVSIRRKSLRHLARSMNFPTFPMLTRMCGSTRVRDYWNLIFNEDYMVMSRLQAEAGKASTHSLEAMSDEELHDFAWRRFLAPHDKGLTREEVQQRILDYFDFLGEEFLKDGTTPNLIVLTNYVMGYYNDPAFLEEDFASLEEGNDFQYMAHLGKDAFLRRLEFENGSLRDQVEAHTQKLLEQRAALKKAEEQTKAVEA